MLRKILAPALCVTGMLTSVAALAGFQTEQDVIIGPSWARGDLGWVRNSPDSIQYIGCINSSSGATCMAADKTGVSRSCTTRNPALLVMVRSLQSDSQLMFSWVNTSPTTAICDSIVVNNESYTLTK